MPLAFPVAAAPRVVATSSTPDPHTTVLPRADSLPATHPTRRSLFRESEHATPVRGRRIPPGKYQKRSRSNCGTDAAPAPASPAPASVARLRPTVAAFVVACRYAARCLSEALPVSPPGNTAPSGLPRPAETLPALPPAFAARSYKPVLRVMDSRSSDLFNRGIQLLEEGTAVHVCDLILRFVGRPSYSTEDDDHTSAVSGHFLPGHGPRSST